MAMSELKQKLLIHGLARIGYPNAAYNAVTDRVDVQGGNDRMPAINNTGDIRYGVEYSHLSINTIRPIVDSVNESVAAWEKARTVPFDDLKQFRMFAAYNNIVLAARDDTELGRGLHFVTWRYNHDLTSAEHGFYTEDYNAAKENFASRSGLVSQNKLFTPEQAAEINAAIEYRIKNDGDITIREEDELNEIAAKLRAAYHIFEEQETQEIDDVVITNASETISLDETFDSEPQNNRHTVLMERLNKNLSDYHKQLEGFGNRELIDMASKISAMAETHEYMTAHHYESHELDFFLQFKNPLEVVADAWNDRSTDLSDMDFTLRDVCDKEYALVEYPLMSSIDPPTDNDLHRYMDVDLELYLGKIAEKVSIQNIAHWEIDAQILKRAASSDNPEEKRFFWIVCDSGSHICNERDTFIKDTLEFAFMTEYKQDAPDTFAFYVEITGADENGIIKGNVFEIGDCAKFAQHIRNIAEPLESRTLFYSKDGGVNSGKVINVSQEEFATNGNRLMNENGNVINWVYHPEDKVRLAAVVSGERSKRMEIPIADESELLQKVEEKLAEVRKPPKQSITDEQRFENKMTELLPDADAEAIQNLITYAKELDKDETCAKSDFFDDTFAGFNLVKQQYGEEHARQVLDLCKTFALNPFEIRGAAFELQKGTHPTEIRRIAVDSDLDPPDGEPFCTYEALEAFKRGTLHSNSNNNEAQICKPSETPAQTTETTKPKTLAEKMQAANEKVKAQDEQSTNTKSHKREERE